MTPSVITTAIHDKTNQPSVVSISWGGPEASWTPQAMTTMDEAFQSAAALGVTVCCAAGDDGSIQESGVGVWGEIEDNLRARRNRTGDLKPLRSLRSGFLQRAPAALTPDSADSADQRCA